MQKPLPSAVVWLVPQAKPSGELVVNLFTVCATHQHESAPPCRLVRRMGGWGGKEKEPMFLRPVEIQHIQWDAAGSYAWVRGPEAR